MKPVTLDSVTFRWPDDPRVTPAPVFANLTVALPDGLTFLVGPNGIGKSTLMLIAAARIFPEAGTVRILDVDAARFADAPMDPALEQERNQLVSVVYQNMEFETDESIDAVFEMVVAGARHPEQAATLRAGLVAAAELDARLGARMHELSKGEMQRAIVVMSLLYGSPVVMMDEPVFAVEPSRARRLFGAIREHCAATGTVVYASVHDVELAREFADNVVLFDADGTIETGAAGELLNRERLETAFRAPYDTLYQRQNLYRDMLTRRYDPEAGGGSE